MAQQDVLVVVGSMDGKSADKTFAKGFGVASWSFGVTNDASSSAGHMGGATGKASWSELHLTLTPGKGNAEFMAATAKHTPQATVDLHCRAGSDNPKEFFTLKLKKCLVTSYQCGGSGGSYSDSVTISYQEVELTTGIVDMDKVELGNPVHFNIATNTG